MLHVMPDVWARCENVIWVCSVAPYLLFGVAARPQSCIDELKYKTSLQVIERNPTCLGQDHSNKLGTGHGYESMKPGSTHTTLCLSSMICLVGNRMPSLARFFNSLYEAGTNPHISILVSLGGQLKPDLNRPYSVDL